ncbi:MAG: MotA/TolQ/ExbB proton channel family protein [Planctomycetota bacterium]
MSRPVNLVQAATNSPIVWGGLATVGFYGLVRAGVLDSPAILRYFAGHPVEYVETALFFVALAALGLKALDVARQIPGLRTSPLGPPARSTETSALCEALLTRLDQLPGRRQGEYFIGRLRAALEHVWRRGSADELDEELRILATEDSDRLHASYGLFRLVIWAIPILGFLGTVIGITMAIANLSAEEAVALAEAVQKPLATDSVSKVTAGLGVAFDTTTLALSLSIVLMVLQFAIDRLEGWLLSEVDHRVGTELSGRFERLPSGPEGQVVAVQRMAESVLTAMEKLAQHQAEVLASTMQSAAARWMQMADTATGRLQTALAAGLQESVKQHAQHLASHEQSLGQQNRQHWDKVQAAQTEAARSLANMQATLAHEVEVLTSAVQAAGEVGRLEAALNKNLAALAGAKNFEQTVMSLAATIHLLNARLAELPAPAAVKLESGKRNSMAA